MFVLKNCDYCTVNSNATKKAVLEVYKIKNIEVIPMGVDLKAFREDKKDILLKKKIGINKEFLLTVGRLVDQKGIDYLIKAMPEILKDFPDAKLLIIGDGPEKRNLENLTKNMNLLENIKFTGKLPNKELPKYYATADVFIGPFIKTDIGWIEAMGVVFLEAIASKTVVIGTNTGGIPDIIKNEKTGLLIEQKNSVEIANTVKRILKDKKLAKKLILNGKRHIEKNYSWNVVVNKFEKIYKNLT